MTDVIPNFQIFFDAAIQNEGIRPKAAGVDIQILSCRNIIDLKYPPKSDIIYNYFLNPSICKFSFLRFDFL